MIADIFLKLTAYIENVALHRNLDYDKQNEMSTTMDIIEVKKSIPFLRSFE